MPVVLHSESCCDICLDAYTDTPQTWPHAISCGHIFCKSCLLNVSPAICPFCRVAFDPTQLKKLQVDHWTPSAPAADVAYASHPRPCLLPFHRLTTFSDHSVEFDGKTYPTSAHLFQAHKFFPAHPDLAERIRTLPAPRDACREARRLQRLCRPDWFDVRISVMDMILERKFSQHARLRRLLLRTGTRDLVESSPRDDFWGIGADGMGRNELGKSLMRVRQKLRSHV